jgi:hypothetical protein
MSHVKIKRYERDVAITLHTTTNLAATLRLDDMAGGAVSFGTMSTNASTLQMWGSHTLDGAFRRVYGADGSAADITLAPSSTDGRMYALPDAVFAVPFLKVVAASTNGTGTAGTVMFKS